jgi:hypothetical protein
MPEDVIVEYARTRIGQTGDSLLLGHFHEPFQAAVGEGEVVVFDAWFRSHQIEWIDPLVEERSG